jgi:hypothetical protein
MLQEVDLLGTLLLRGGELVAAKHTPRRTGHEGLAVVRRIADATSQLHLAAAMVVRNTSSLDQMIGEVLGDAAARLRAFDTAQGISTEFTS